MNMTYNTGIYTSDLKTYDGSIKDLIAERVYFKSINYSEFMDAVVTEDTQSLDLIKKYPKQVILPTFEITEGGTGIYEKVGYFYQNFSMKKFRSKLMIDDESKARGDEPSNWNYSIDLCARGMADARDEEILDTLLKGVGPTDAATTKWNDDSADIVGDIANLLEAVFDQDDTNLTEDELSNMIVYYPLKLIGRLKLPEMFRDNGTSGGTMGRLRTDASDSWLMQKLGFTFKGSRRLNGLNTALCVIPGPMTATHYNYVGKEMPRVAYVRDDDEGSDSYLMTSRFVTKVHPQNYTRATTNDHILSLTVVSD